MSRTLSGLFLVGALNRPRKRKRTNRENPRTIPEQIGKIPGKVPKGQKRTKKEGNVQIGKPPRLKHPRLAALNHCVTIAQLLRHFPRPLLLRPQYPSLDFVVLVSGKSGFSFGFQFRSKRRGWGIFCLFSSAFFAFWCPHFPPFRCGISQTLAFWGERDLPHFPCIGFGPLISKIRSTIFSMNGIR